MPSLDTILSLVTACLLVWVTIKTHQTGEAVQQVHLAVNSRLDQLLKTTKDLATQTGHAQATEERRLRDNESDERLSKT